MTEPKPPAFEDVPASQAYWLERLYENRAAPSPEPFDPRSADIMIGLLVIGAFLGSMLTLAWHG